MSHLSVSKIKKLFKRYDDHKDGSIEPKCLIAILKMIHPEMSSEEINALMKVVDQNHDGLIQYDELVDLIFFDLPHQRSVTKTRRHEFPEETAKALWVFWQLLTAETIPGGMVDRTVLLEALSPGSSKFIEANHILMGNGTGGKEEAKLLGRLSSHEVENRIQKAPEKVSQDMLIRAVWPRMKEQDFVTVQRLMRKFLAQLGLSGVFRAVIEHEHVDFHPEELQFLFNEIDIDHDGFISVKEMVKVGKLEKTKALALSEALDITCEDGLLSLEELITAFTKTDCTVSQSLKAMFARRSSAVAVHNDE